MSADSQAMGRNGVFFWLHGMVLSLLGIFLNYKIQGKSNSLCALVSLSLFFFLSCTQTPATIRFLK